MKKITPIFFEIRKDASRFLPRLQSHRGYRNAEIPVSENSLNSIKKSYELGYEMVEFDVRMTRDQQIILFHDEKIEGFKVSNLTLEELRMKVPVDLLSDVFYWFKNSARPDFKLNVEIKSKAVNGRLEKIVFDLISQFKIQKRILISSFNPISLAYFRGFDPIIFRSLLLTYEKQYGNNVFIKKMMLNVTCRPNALHLREDDWNLQKFKYLLDSQVPIVLWTCNDLVVSKKYFEEGITGIISDLITPVQLNT